tara:strand:+ start:1620 stop:2072 length:453 start_codon:yes stop_codon:yes gene_type:complete
MKKIVLLLVGLTVFSCGKDSVEIEIIENSKLDEDVMQYALFINPSNGGTVKILSQEGIINETDLASVPITSLTNTGGGVTLTGKLADLFDRDTELNISVTTDEGFKFTGWTIHICNKCYWSSRTYYKNEPSIKLNINSDLWLIANFKKIN